MPFWGKKPSLEETTGIWDWKRLLGQCSLLQFSASGLCEGFVMSSEQPRPLTCPIGDHQLDCILHHNMASYLIHLRQQSPLAHLACRSHSLHRDWNFALVLHPALPGVPRAAPTLYRQSIYKHSYKWTTDGDWGLLQCLQTLTLFHKRWNTFCLFCQYSSWDSWISLSIITFCGHVETSAFPTGNQKRDRGSQVA